MLSCDTICGVLKAAKNKGLRGDDKGSYICDTYKGNA